MVHMFSLVMFGLCSPCSLTNQWDKLPIDLLEVYFPKWELPWRLIWAWRFGTPVPLYYYVLWAMITKVWNPCPSFLLHNVGTDHEGVEPLYYSFTLHCGHWSPRCGTPVLLFYFKLWALIKVWNPCSTFLLHTVGTDHQGVEPLSYFSTSQCGQCSPRCGTPVPFHSARFWQCSPRCGTPVLLFYFTLLALINKVWNPCRTYLLHTEGTDHQGVEPLSYFSTSHCGTDHPGVEPLFYFSTSNCGHWSPRRGTPVLITFLRATVS